MGSRSRLFAALSLAVLPVTTGLVAAPSFAATAVNATGGCWNYLPANSVEEPVTDWTDVTVERLADLGVGSDISLELIDWSPTGSDATLEIASTGSTAQGGARNVTLELLNGPVLSPDAVSGTAHAVLQVFVPGGDEDTPQIVFVSTPFAAEAGVPLGQLNFDGPAAVDLPVDGAYAVTLQQVLFVADTTPTQAPRMWACNAQEEGQPSDEVVTGGVAVPGVNPATTPEAMSAIYTGFDVAEVSILRADDIVGQYSTRAARAGDQIVLQASGLVTDADYGVEFVPASGAPVRAAQPLRSDATGATEVVVVDVPEGLAAGVGAVRLVDTAGAPAGVDLSLRILGAPSVEVTEVVGEESIELTVRGTDFDPLTELRMRTRAGDASGKDAAATVTPEADGTFETTYEVTDTEATGVRVRQPRQDGRTEHVVLHTLENAVPAPPADEEPPGDEEPPASDPPLSNNPPSTEVPATPAPTTPPVQIPVPDQRPIDTITAPEVEEPQEPRLTVSETRLEGSPSLGELFGGVSKRQVRFELENTGDGAAENPAVLLGVGRTDEITPGVLATEVGDLAAGARVAVGVNVSLPMASFGTYQVVAQVGEEGGPAFTLRWDTFPWGLIGVNVAGIGLLAWGVSRRRSTAAPLPTGPAGEEMGASVVDLAALDKWWKDGKVVHTPVETDDNDSVVDLEAADRWWSRNQNKVS